MQLTFEPENLLLAVKFFCQIFQSSHVLQFCLFVSQYCFLLMLLITSFPVWFSYVLFSISLILLVSSTIISVVLTSLSTILFLTILQSLPFLWLLITNSLGGWSLEGWWHHLFKLLCYLYLSGNLMMEYLIYCFAD